MLSRHKQLKRRTVLKGAVASLAVPSVLRGRAHAAGEPMRVGIIPAYSFGLYWLVQDQGFAPGVDMKFTVFQSGPPALEALVGGFVDAITVGSVPPLSAMYRRVADFREISVCGDASGLFTIVGAPQITSLADLEGRRIAVTAGTNFEYFLDSVLILNGLEDMPLTRVDLQPVDGQNSLVAGSVDATVPLATSRNLIFGALPGANMLVDGATIPLGQRPGIMDVLVTTQQYIESHEDALIEIVAAFHGSAVPMLRQDNAAVVERMVAWQRQLGRAGVTASEVEPILNGYFFFDTEEIKAVYADGVLADSLRRQSEFLISAGRIEGMPDLDALVSDQIVKRI